MALYIDEDVDTFLHALGQFELDGDADALSVLKSLVASSDIVNDFLELNWDVAARFAIAEDVL